MRSPTWETSNGALAAFLNSTTQAFMVDLYTITLSGGTAVRFTSSDATTVVNTLTFYAGPTIERGTTRLSVGVEVDSLDVTIAADNTMLVGTVPILKFIAAGGFDGAKMLVERAFATAPGAAWIGTIGMFKGRVSGVQPGRYSAQLTVNADSELLNVMIPRNVYQAGCANTLYDPSCGVNKATSALVATASSVTDATLTTFSTSETFTAGRLALGFAVGTTGANAGLQRTIKTNAANSITTIQPWALPVASTDTFAVYPGCDKTKATCASKFSNVINFRGFPYIPAPESVT